MWQALVDAEGGHLTVEDIIARVFENTPFVNLSTVYRTLQLLVDDVLVRRTDLGNQRAYYEVAHDHLHHHIVCTSCGAVAHVHDDALGELAQRIMDASGYVLENTELTLRGRCGHCAPCA